MMLSLDNYEDFNFSKESERILKMLELYDVFIEHKDVANPPQELKFIAGLLLEREELFQKLLLQLHKGLCLQDYNTTKKKSLVYYLAQYKKLEKFNKILKKIKSIDFILFTWFPEEYIKNLKNGEVKKRVVYCLWNDIIGASFLELNGEYYFLSYIYKGSEKEVERVFTKYYSLLQVLCGELGLGYWEKGLRSVGFYAKDEWMPFIIKCFGSVNKVRGDYYIYQFNKEGRRIVNEYAGLCNLEVMRKASKTIERKLVDWDKVLI